MTLSNHAAQMEAGRKPARKRIWSRLLAGAGLGAMVLTVLSFLPGCGSDSTPGDSVQGKNAKAAANRQKHDPRQMILPGAGTQADYNAARQQIKPDNRQMLPPLGGK